MKFQLTHREHIVTFVVWFLALLLLNVELAEEVECNDSIEVDDNTCQHERQHQLLPYVR
jgi:hypothetical protein